MPDINNHTRAPATEHFRQIVPLIPLAGPDGSLGLAGAEASLASAMRHRDWVLERLMEASYARMGEAEREAWIDRAVDVANAAVTAKRRIEEHRTKRLPAAGLKARRKESKQRDILEAYAKEQAKGREWNSMLTARTASRLGCSARYVNKIVEKAKKSGTFNAET